MGDLFGFLAAGRSGRNIDLLGRQGQEDGLGLESGEGEIEGARDPVLGVAVEPGAGDRLFDAPLERLGQLPDAGALCASLLAQDADGLAEADDAGRVLGPGPETPLLAPAVDKGTDR